MNETDNNINNIKQNKNIQPENENVIVRSKFNRFLFATGGVMALILAILGIFVPGLPCTPFALLSAALFAKSSPKLYNWVLNNKFLGWRIKNYQKRKGITKSGKIKIIILMCTMVLLSAFIIIKPITIRIIVLSAGFIGCVVVWFFVPEGKDIVNTEK